ncbi:MAG: hypothetical protein CMB99_00300 [Flavobacteriaceae bacterium]|nr:hypothetical protein [Flavobacteriaceae bacterium]
MKIGDKVRLTEEGRMMFPEIGDKELTLIDHPSNIYPYAARWEEGEEGWSLFNEDELEVVKDDPLPLGTRVRVKSNSRFYDHTGEVVSFYDRTGEVVSNIGGPYPYGLRFDGEEHQSSGRWSLDALEVMEDEPEPETNEDLEWLLATARDAQWIFEHYAKLHSEKSTADGIYKSMFNLMIADRLADAVEANS